MNECISAKKETECHSDEAKSSDRTNSECFSDEEDIDVVDDSDSGEENNAEGNILLKKTDKLIKIDKLKKILFPLLLWFDFFHFSFFLIHVITFPL